jgi:hypothetical protein
VWHLGCWWLEGQPAGLSPDTSPATLHLTFWPSAAKVSDGSCGIQWYSLELLTMGIVVPKTCWVYYKFNNILSSIYLVFLLSSHLRLL